ncbi:MAG: hypothetical protein KatS3mg124_2280 [Porticoccaceae bacterium]|nr:MAG: hypothetical protein KatS3mg124_2280 [Porticoccaceae bacterium]
MGPVRSPGKAARRERRRDARCLALLALLWAAALAGWRGLEYALVDWPHRRAVEKVLAARADHFRQQLEGELGRLVATVDALAADPASRQVLVSAVRRESRWVRASRTLPVLDPVSAWRATARAALGGRGEVHLVRRGQEASPRPGDYAAQWLLGEALAGHRPPPLAARTDAWRLYLARPVDGPEPAGALLVTLGLSELTVPDPGPEGRLELVQILADRRSAVVFGAGEGARNAYRVEMPTRWPNLRVRFTAGRALIESLAPPRIGIALAAVLLAALTAFATQSVAARCLAGGPAPTGGRRPPAHPAPQGTPASAPPAGEAVPPQVFREYDIRGRAGSEITADFARRLGRALGSWLLERGHHTVLVGRDGRLSSLQLSQALTEGLATTGCDLVQLGQVPTPVVNFALAAGLGAASAAVAVTASHNPKHDNGFKIVVDDRPLAPEELQALRGAMEQGGPFREGRGTVEGLDPLPAYRQRILADVAVDARFKVAVDCGNGVAGAVAPELLAALGQEVVPLFAEVDGNFPNHDPDPTVPANLRELATLVREQHCDLGLALDGDGDRLVAVTAEGRIVWPDELLMLFARDCLPRHPGAAVVFDIKCSRRLPALVEAYGGQPVAWKTGHANIRRKLLEEGALLAGEFSGHLFFPDRHGTFDDGCYAAARLLEILARREQSLAEAVASLPSAVATPELRLPVAEAEKFALVERFRDQDFDSARVVDLDGVRVEWANGFGLLRASNTGPALTLRFEADDEEALAAILGDFEARLARLDPRLATALSRAVRAARTPW